MVKIMDNSTGKSLQKNEAGTDQKAVKMKKEKKPKKEKTPLEKKKRKKLIRRCVILGAVVLIAGYMVFSSIAAQNRQLPVYTTQALRGSVQENLNTSGTVKSERYKIYFPPAEVSVGVLNVELGDAVSEGDQLLVYDTKESEFGMNKASLQANSVSNGYSSSVYNSNDHASRVQEAEMNLATVEPMIESQKVKIQNMESYLEDAKSREKVKLYNEQYRLQKELNSLTEEQSIAASEGDRIGEGVYQSVEKVSNQLNKVTLELTLLEEDAELTYIERDIVNEKNVLTDLETYKQKQEAIRDGSEPQVMNVYDRRKLEADSALSQLEFEEAKKNYEEALNGIIADFDGIVTELNIAEGGLAAPATSVLKLESSTEVKVTFNVSKYDLEKLELGQKAEVNISGHLYDGTVSKINRMATTGPSGTPIVGAEIHINNPDDYIYLGVEAKLVIHTNEAEDVVLIPIEVVNADKTGDFCYVVENGVVAKRRIVTGISSDMYTEVKEGLSEGEEVITNLLQASEGMAVVSVNQDAGAVPAEGGVTEDAAAASDGSAAASDETDAAETEGQAE